MSERNRLTRSTNLTLLVCGLVSSVAAGAEPITIDHTAVGCVVAGKFAGLEARFKPTDEVARARIFFSAETNARWYFVEMKPSEGVYRGVLPKPLKETRRFHYYIETVDKSFSESRTAEYSPMVAGSGECGKTGLLTATPVAKATVGVGTAEAQAPAVPAGFSSEGVVGLSVVAAAASSAGVAVASGGHGTAILLGVAGAGAAAAGIVVAASGSDSTTTTTLPPAAGHWVGSWTRDQSAPSVQCGIVTYDWVLDISQSGTSLAGSSQLTVRQNLGVPAVRTVGGSCGSPGERFSATLAGTISGNSVTFRLSDNNDRQFAGTLNGNTMNGTSSYPNLPNVPEPPGTWSIQKQ